MGAVKIQQNQPEVALQAVRESIRQNAKLNVPYVLMNALATIVASYGLLSNSTAVVIGAMIIAMLLGPISGIALALVDGDVQLLRQAIIAEVAGVLVVLGVAFGIGFIHRDLPLTHEILSRTSPNILDLVIALAGGAAGAYATVSPRLSVGLVGVAIATALVPPLATCSICIARGDLRLAFGGFLLFFANLVAIQFASSVVMWAHGYHLLTKKTGDSRAYASRIAFSVFMLVTLGIVLGLNFSRTLSKELEQSATRDRLVSALRAYPGVFLADVRFVAEKDQRMVYAVVRTPYSLGPKIVAKIESTLPHIDGVPPELHVRSVITKETTSHGYLHEMKDKSGSEPLRDTQLENGG